MLRSRRGLIAVVAVVVVAAVSAGAAFALRPSTTGIPGTYQTINVKITDKALILSKHSSIGVQVIGFRIRNVGKKKHNFIIGDYSTNAIAPGQFDDFAVQFDVFRKYVARCTLNCPKSAKTTVNVQRGDFQDNG